MSERPTSPPNGAKASGRELPRVIASDLDGTLLGGDSQLTDRTVAAVEAAIDAGVTFIAATGRSWRSALPKLERTSIRYITCSNGGLVWDRETEAPFIHRPMSGADAAHAVSSVSSAHGTAGFGWETLRGFRFDQAFSEACPHVDEIGLGDDPGPLDEIDAVTKMFVCIPGLQRLELQNAVQAVLPASVTGTASGASFIETTAAGVDKATTIEQFVTKMGFGSGDVLAFGDNLNDVAMLEWAGRSVAMANAHDNVTKHADEIAMSNLDDGVAVYIERLLR